MISSIWHVRGSVQAHNGVPDDLLLERIARLLDGQQKPIIRRTPTGIEFAGPLRWSIAPTMRNLSLGWSAMRDVDSGTFWIERATDGPLLHYDIRLLRLFSLILTAALILFIVFSIRGYPIFAVVFGIFVVIWLYVPSVLLARVRIRRKIRAAVKHGY